MRQPAGYVASIKTSSSKHSGPGLGVRRKSSLSLGGQGRNSTSPAPPSENEMGDSMAEQHEGFDGNDDIDVGGEKLV